MLWVVWRQLFFQKQFYQIEERRWCGDVMDDEKASNKSITRRWPTTKQGYTCEGVH
jgi:hypothetical protein